jgi:transcriptional regulator with XRE-family HTH domain
MAKVHARKARDLSSVLVAARRRRGWSQGELADRIGVSRDYVGDLESGQLSLQVSRLMRLFGELGVDIVLTLPDSTDEPKAPHA